MKQVILGLLCCFPLILFSQNIYDDIFPIENEKVKYTGTVHVDSTLKTSELFISAKMWANNAFYPSTTIIKLDDKEAGILIIDSYVVNGSGNFIQDHKIWFTIKLEFRDGRYRYTIDNLKSKFLGYYKRYDGPIETWIPKSYLDYTEDRPMGPKQIEKCKEEYLQFCKSLDSDFKSFLSSLERSLKENRSKEQW